MVREEAGDVRWLCPRVPFSCTSLRTITLAQHDLRADLILLSRFTHECTIALDHESLRSYND
jgi:hypothetical protein